MKERFLAGCFIAKFLILHQQIRPKITGSSTGTASKQILRIPILSQSSNLMNQQYSKQTIIGDSCFECIIRSTQ
jgi:hypothetical protein